MTNTKHEPLIEAFKSVIVGICSHKASLRFETEKTENSIILVVCPHMADFPKLAGKLGKQINALKFLFKTAAANIGFNSDSDVRLEESFIGSRLEQFTVPPPPFDAKELEKIVKEIAEATMGCPVEVKSRTLAGRYKVYVKPRVFGPNSSTIVAAMDAVFYPYAMAHGKRGLDMRLARED